MNILVIGAGGTGGCIGGYLAKQGEKVTLIARGEHLAAIQRDGLRVKSARIGDFTVHPPAFTTESYPADRLPGRSRPEAPQGRGLRYDQIRFPYRTLSAGGRV